MSEILEDLEKIYLIQNEYVNSLNHLKRLRKIDISYHVSGIATWILQDILLGILDGSKYFVKQKGIKKLQNLETIICINMDTWGKSIDKNYWKSKGVKIIC